MRQGDRVTMPPMAEDDAAPLCIFELSQIGDNALPGSASASIRFDQRPVGVSLAILCSVTRPDEHARILRGNRPHSSRKVFTRSRFTFQRPGNRPFRVKPGKLHPLSDPVWTQSISGKMNFRAEVAKLG